MKPVAAPLAIASAILVLSIVVALMLIPVLDAELRRATARKAAALTKLAGRVEQKDPTA